MLWPRASPSCCRCSDMRAGIFIAGSWSMKGLCQSGSIRVDNALGGMRQETLRKGIALFKRARKGAESVGASRRERHSPQAADPPEPVAAGVTAGTGKGGNGNALFSWPPESQDSFKSGHKGAFRGQRAHIPGRARNAHPIAANHEGGLSLVPPFATVHLAVHLREEKDERSRHHRRAVLRAHGP